MRVPEEIARIFGRRGSEAYFGESVSILEHSLQTAYLAHRANATPSLVIAALLHDIGHLIGHAPSDLAEWIDDAHHEELGGRWLAIRFGAAVSEPVRLHVPAKRYLCATRPGYFELLTCASVVTLRLQGGPMSETEVAGFEALPQWRDAIDLRLWDDHGKVSGLMTPTLDDYRGLIEELHAARPMADRQ